MIKAVVLSEYLVLVGPAGEGVEDRNTVLGELTPYQLNSIAMELWWEEALAEYIGMNSWSPASNQNVIEDSGLGSGLVTSNPAPPADRDRAKAPVVDLVPNQAHRPRVPARRVLSTQPMAALHAGEVTTVVPPPP